MTKINVRTQEVKGDKLSIFLDFYPPIISPKTGKPTRREFLNLYVFKNPKTRAEKAHNKSTYDKATLICMERRNSLDTPIGAEEQAKKDITILEFATKVFLNDSLSVKSKDIYTTAINRLKKYLKDSGIEDIKLSDVNKIFCNKYRDYLVTITSLNHKVKKDVAQNSKALYFSIFLIMINKAYDLEYIDANVADKIKNIPFKKTSRAFLSLDELNRFAKVEVDGLADIIKRAALFSALTGLRFSDVQKLTWGEVKEENQEYTIQFRQKKTKEVEFLPISAQAYKILGDRQDKNTIVFKGLKYSNYVTKFLREILISVGIDKKITFHCFRHTFATLQLEAGTDLYTVSKMLGHRDITTTQIYAKIVDKTKREASNRIRLDI